MKWSELCLRRLVTLSVRKLGDGHWAMEAVRDEAMCPGPDSSLTDGDGLGADLEAGLH